MFKKCSVEYAALVGCGVLLTQVLQDFSIMALFQSRMRLDSNLGLVRLAMIAGLMPISDFFTLLGLSFWFKKWVQTPCR
jgi:hypothetical protein